MKLKGVTYAVELLLFPSIDSFWVKGSKLLKAGLYMFVQLIYGIAIYPLLILLVLKLIKLLGRFVIVEQRLFILLVEEFC